MFYCVILGGFSSTFLLDANGRMRETFPVPAEAEAIRIQVLIAVSMRCFLLTLLTQCLHETAQRSNVLLFVVSLPRTYLHAR